MEFVEFSWIHGEDSLKQGLQKVLGSSGQLIKKHFSSKVQDKRIGAHEVSKLPLDFVNHLSINPIYVGPEVKILHETANYLAVHKPCNIHCHPHSYLDQDTVLNALLVMGKSEGLAVNSSNYDRGLLYRLDYETSGVLLIAKNEKLFNQARTDFHQVFKRKFYWVMVKGEFDKEGAWQHWFRATGVKGAKQKVSDDEYPASQSANMSVFKVMQHEGMSLLLVNLKTGLRHQIIAQLSALGFPIVGDELYGGIKAERLFLHALRYEWLDVVEDSQADLFDRFFDMNRGLQMTHDMLRRF